MTLSRRTLLSSAAAAVVAPAVVPFPARAAADSELVLGTHLDLSGALAVVSPPLRRGLQMRVDEANERGGIHGRKVRLVVEDNASQPPQAVRVVDKLLRRDEVFAMVGTFGTSTNVATVKKVVDANVICFAPFGASSLFRQAVNNDPRLLTTMQNYDTTTFAGVDWALAKLGVRKVGFIYLEGPFGDVAIKGLRSALAQRNGELVAQAGYKSGDIDFSSHVARMRAAGAEFIFGATPPRETAAIASEMRKIGWTKAKFMTATPARANMLAALGKEDVEGVYGIGTYPIAPFDKATGTLKVWGDAYRRRFNAEPDDTAALYYAYMDWFLTAVQDTGRDLTVDKLLKTLQASNYKGFSSYEAQHFVGNHATPEWIQVEQLQKGRWVSQSPLINPAKPV
jgi:branched-chain amino acid transport system substrate-binding protein